MNDRYIKLRIPFASKKYIQRSTANDDFKIKGNAYYIFDTITNKYIDEYIEIVESNFRMTDRCMVKPTEYYKNPVVKKFRDNYLDKYSNNSNPESIVNKKYFDLNQDQINELNKLLKKEKVTIRVMYSILSGSNVSGAETNHRATQLICNTNDKFHGCNFANPLKAFASSQKHKKKIDVTNLKVYELRNLVEEISIIKNFSKEFFTYNEHLGFEDTFPEILETEDIENFVKNENENFTFPDKQLSFIEGYKNQTLDNFKEITNKKLKDVLYSYFSSNVRKCIKNKLIPLHHTIVKTNLKQIENAHIISRKLLMKYGRFKEIIDPYNCLRIDKTYHGLFDQGEIEFNNFGEVESKNRTFKYLDIEIINKSKETKKYFEWYLNNLKKNK